MKILQVSPYYAPAWAYGGPPRVVFELTEGLKERGHYVTVLTTDTLSQGERAKPGKSDGGEEVCRLRNLSNYAAWKYHAFLPIGARRFLKSRVSDFDIVHVHEFRTLLSVAVNRYATEAGVPYVLSAHGSVPHQAGRLTAKEVFDRLAGNRILAEARRVIAISNHELIDYQNKGIPTSRISVVYNGINPRDFENLPERGDFETKRGLIGRRTFLYLGRVNIRKGLDVLVRAFTDLAANTHDIALVIAGPDDGYGRQLRSIVDNLSPKAPIIITGYLPAEERLAAIVDSVAAVYPCRREAFGIVPLEALMCSRPVIVSEDSGSGEFLKEAQACITVPPDDPDALRQAMAFVLNSGNLNEMVERGNRAIRQELDWRTVAGRVERVYSEALADEV